VVCGIGVVETIKRKGTASRVRIQVSSNSLIRIPKVSQSIIPLRNAGRIKVINNGRIEHPVQGDSVQLLRGEDVSSRPFVNVTEPDGVLELPNVGCVSPIGSYALSSGTANLGSPQNFGANRSWKGLNE